MAKKKPETAPAVYRTDLLPSNLTARKEAALRELLAAYRTGAVMLAREQWRIFFETGRFNKKYDKDKTTYVAVIGAANRVQMCRHQVVGQLKAWVSLCANDFRDKVVRSSLSPETKHMLHVVNVAQAWFSPDPIFMPKSAGNLAGTEIPEETRRLARTIMRHVMGQHRRPDVSNISMWLDARVRAFSRPETATQDGRVSWWLRLPTMHNKRKVFVPLLRHKHHESRKGNVADGVQINLDRDGNITFGLVTDIGAVCAQQRAEYEGRGPIAIDFGLSTLFATSEGQLLGQNWLRELRRYDERITNIARGMRRRGLKPRDSKRYRAAVTALRGFLKTEIGRVINKLVEERRPTELVQERLDFQHATLSRRLNRLVRNAGRSIVKKKLQDIEERYGVTSSEVSPAYTSQTCSCCGYVDKRNRRNQKTFQCLWCGNQLHADLNAARNIGGRRAASIGSVFQGKTAILAGLVSQFGERRVYSTRSGEWGPAADPRLSNPYFKGRRKRGSDVAFKNPSQETVAA